jgi:hypothetical protein
VISTARGLALLGVVAVAMVATLFIDLHRAEPARDHTLVSGFDEARVTKLTWAAPTAPFARAISPDGTYLAIERGTPHAPWRRTLPSSGEVDQGAVGDILAALRGGRWQRIGDVAQAGEGQVKLTIEMRTDTGVESIVLGLGAPAERDTAGVRPNQPEHVHDAQVWIARGDHAYLVDAWVAAALQPDALALAVTHPIAPAANAPTITFWNKAGDLTVSGEGTDNRIVQPGVKSSDDGVRLDPAVSHELERALAGIEVVALASSHTASGAQVATPVANTDVLQIEWAGSRANLGTTSCNGNDRYVELIAPSGGGCVEAADATELRDLLTRLRGPASGYAAKAPIPFPVGVVQFGDGQELDVTKRARIGRRASMNTADTARAQQLLAALAAPAELFDVAPAQAPPGAVVDGPDAKKLVIRGNHGAEQTLVLGEKPTVWRVNERVALRLTPEAWDIIARPPSEYIDLQLWSEEPTTIVTVAIGDEQFTRGAVIGEWTGAKDPEAIDALVALLAAPQGLAHTTTTGHGVTVTMTIQPPTSAPYKRTLELVTQGKACIARIWTQIPFPSDGTLLDHVDGELAMKPELCAAARAAK